MTETRKIDKAATKAARARQAAGVARLDAAFRLPPWIVRLRGIPVQTSLRHGFVAAVAPLRKNPDSPRRRSDAEWHRKRKRDLARDARRRNRA